MDLGIASLDETMTVLRKYRARLNQYLLGGNVSIAEILAEKTDVEDKQRGWGGTYRLASSEWEMVPNARLQLILSICLKSDSELLDYISEFDSNPEFRSRSEIRDYIEPFKNGRRLLERCALQMQTTLQARGVPGNLETTTEQHVRRVVEQITTRTQVQIGLRQACEEMKKRSPEFLHADIERAFRKAEEELRDR